MKKIIITSIAIITLFSCSNEKTENPDLQELTTKKTAILKSIDSLNSELRLVESQIVKLDSSAKLHLVTLLPVKDTLFKHYLEIQGAVQADKNIIITPEMGGTITSIFVKDGQKVAAGQALVQLDDATLRNNIAQLKTQLALATTTFERQQRLWNDKIGSEMQYLQAKAQKESLESNLASLQSQAAKARITAPFSGTIDEIFPRIGELTGPQTPIVRLINLDKVYIEAEITEAYLPIVKKGTEVIVTFPTLNKEIVSTVAQVSNFINPENRSFKVQVNIPNKDKEIKPNLLSELKILDFTANGIVVPSHLIQQDQHGHDYVFVAQEKNNETEVIKKPVTTASEYKNDVYVSEGLSKNDTLVDEGARLVKAGDFVRVETNN